MAERKSTTSRWLTRFNLKGEIQGNQEKEHIRESFRNNQRCKTQSREGQSSGPCSNQRIDEMEEGPVDESEHAILGTQDQEYQSIESTVKAGLTTTDTLGQTKISSRKRVLSINTYFKPAIE